jgi:hypothetical protein
VGTEIRYELEVYQPIFADVAMEMPVIGRGPGHPKSVVARRSSMFSYEKNAVSFSSGQLPYLVHVKHFYAIEYISHLQTARGGKLSARTEGRYM